MKNRHEDILQNKKTPGILIFTRSSSVFTRLGAENRKIGKPSMPA